MAKSKRNHISSCTITWKSTDNLSSVTTKVLQTEIQVRLYNNDNLTGGRIWPMSVQQKQELYSVLYKCIEEWACDDYSVAEPASYNWQFKICSQRNCLRTVYGTNEPPPHGSEIRQILAGIIGEDNCCFF